MTARPARFRKVELQRAVQVAQERGLPGVEIVDGTIRLLLQEPAGTPSPSSPSSPHPTDAGDAGLARKRRPVL